MTERKAYRLISQGIALVVLISAGFLAKGNFPMPSIQPENSAPAAIAQTDGDISAQLPAKTAAQIPAASTSQGRSAKVSRVIDGDTIDVIFDSAATSTKTRIRLLGINTPETVDPRKPVECFGKEASAETKSLLPAGATVMIQSDPSQGMLDKYGRTLGYVIAADGTNIDLKLIQQGFAYEYTYDKPYEYQTEFKAAQNQAQAAGRGLWAPDKCNGQK